EIGDEEDAPAPRFRDDRGARDAVRLDGPGRPGAQAEVRSREVLRHLEGRQERLSDGELVLRRDVAARQSGRRVDLRSVRDVRKGRRRRAYAEARLRRRASGVETAGMISRREATGGTHSAGRETHSAGRGTHSAGRGTLGAGIGVREPHVAEILAGRPAVGWLEAHPGHYMGG